MCKVTGNLGEELDCLPLFTLRAQQKASASASKPWSREVRPPLNPLENSTLEAASGLECASSNTGRWTLSDDFSNGNYWAERPWGFDPPEKNGGRANLPLPASKWGSCHCFTEAVRSHQSLVTVEDKASLWSRTVSLGGWLPERIPRCRVNTVAELQKRPWV